MSKRKQQNGTPYIQPPAAPNVDDVCYRALCCLDKLCETVSACGPCITIQAVHGTAASQSLADPLDLPPGEE